MDTLAQDITPEVIAAALQLHARGFAVVTNPGISLEADARARIASQTEAHFLLGKLPAQVVGKWDDEPTFEEYDEDDSIIYSSTVPCPRCSEVHPT